MSIQRRKFSLIYTTKNVVPFKDNKALHVIITIYAILFIVLAIKPADTFDWWYENSVSILVLVLLSALYRKFKLSNMSYACILIILILHAIGAHYTYSLCPIGEWMKSMWGFKRNNYDRLVAFAFGGLIAFPVMGIVYQRLRVKYIQACILSCVFILSIGTIYELFEMFSVIILNMQQTEIFLGMQGDIWDAQKDISMNLLGTLSSMGSCILFRIRKNQKIHMVRYNKG